MAFDRHTVFGGALVAVIAAAIIGGLTITGGPGLARKEQQDAARLEHVQRAAYALACYQKAEGEIPEDLSIVWAEFSEVGSKAREPLDCRREAFNSSELAAVVDEGFTVRRTDGATTHICAEFAAPSRLSEGRMFRSNDSVVPNLTETRPEAGVHCFEMDLSVDLD